MFTVEHKLTLLANQTQRNPSRQHVSVANPQKIKLKKKKSATANSRDNGCWGQYFYIYPEFSYQVTELAATCQRPNLRNSCSGTETHSNRRSAWGLSGSYSLSKAFTGMLFNIKKALGKLSRPHKRRWRALSVLKKTPSFASNEHQLHPALPEWALTWKMYLAGAVLSKKSVLVSYTGSLDMVAIDAQVATWILKHFWFIEAFWKNIKQTFPVTKSAFATAPGPVKSILVTQITPLGTQRRHA